MALELYITSHCSGCQRLVRTLGGEDAIRARGIIVHNLTTAGEDEIAQAKSRGVSSVPALFEHGIASKRGPMPVILRLREYGIT